MPKEKLKFKNGFFAFASRSLLTFLVAFLVLSFVPGPRYTFANDAPLEAETVESAVQALDFLSETEKRSFSALLLAGERDGLLDFSGALGTEALLEAISSQPNSGKDKVEFVSLYEETLKEDLPVFLITKTSIRLLRRDAPLSTVLRTGRKERDLLARIDSYLEKRDVTPYLAFEDRALLVSTLAESLEIYSRQMSADGSAEGEGEDLGQLRQTIRNLVKFSDLPVSLGDNQNVRGGSSSGSTNEELEDFLQEEDTISDLALFAGLLEK